MNRAHRIRLYPNKTQARLLETSCNVSRFAYNWGLERWQIYYKCGLKLTPNNIKKDFIRLADKLFPWIRGAGKSTYEQAFNDVRFAFKCFFRRVKAGQKPGYPRFKSKRLSRWSFYVANDRIRFYDKRVSIPKVGRVKMAELLRFNGKIMSATVSMEAGQWFMSFSVELPDLPKREVRSALGIDVGISKSLTCSDGRAFQSPKPLKRHTKKLRRLQRSFSRRAKGSKRRKKKQQEIARLWQHIRNVQGDFLHKVTSKLCNENQVIAVEDLNVKGMLKNHKLAKAVSSQCFGMIRQMLEYKAQHFVKVDRFFPSSQLCSICGSKQKMPLHRRLYKCPCGYEADRDWNAALNIVRQALSEFTLVDRKALTRLNKRVKLCLAEARTETVRFSSF